MSDIVRARRLKLFGHVARADGQVPGSLPCSRSMHMAQSQELEAASRSSETYLAENGGGRPASVQPRSCIRVQEGTGQNYLARTHWNGYVTDKPRMMMLMMTPSGSACNLVWPESRQGRSCNRVDIRTSAAVVLVRTLFTVFSLLFYVQRNVTSTAMLLPKW